MKLYFSPGSCGLASQIALREVGESFELVQVDFATKTTVEGDYLKINAKGLVPALMIDDGEVLTESAVILQWIADSYPHKQLLPVLGNSERYKALQWLNYAATDLHRGMALMFSPFVDDASKARFAAGSMTGKFEYLDQHLASNEYLMGKHFSVADAYLFNVLCWPSRVNMDISGYSSIQAFMVRMKQRRSVMASLEAEGLLPA